MKKSIVIGALILALVCVGLLSGCWVGYGYFDLTGWSSSNSAFNNCITGLETPQEICQYMANNFTDTSHAAAYSPYQQWLYEDGDCNDYSTFAIYAAHTHGYEVYQIHVEYTKGKKLAHALGVFRVGSKLNYSDDDRYDPIQASSFQTIVNDFISTINGTLRSWYAMDYDLNKVSEYNMTKSTELHLPMPDPDEFGTLMGEEPINRSGTFGSGYTIINKGVPAQASGTVERIAIWAYRSLSNVEVATFYEVSTGRYSTRDTQYIGSITGGSMREYNVDLDVQKGDLIGIYFTSGSIERSTSGYSGTWSTRGDYIPCTNKSFGSYSGYCISLGGLVISPQ